MGILHTKLRPHDFKIGWALPGTLHKMLTALNECTEWGQVFILDSLSGYLPVRPGPGRSSALRIFHSESIFVWRFCMGARGA